MTFNHVRLFRITTNLNTNNGVKINLNNNKIPFATSILEEISNIKKYKRNLTNYKQLYSKETYLEKYYIYDVSLDKYFENFKYHIFEYIVDKKRNILSITENLETKKFYKLIVNGKQF